jgi:apolipoprotein N-acyltransferase
VTAGELVGLAGVFMVALIPSGIFVGALLGKSLRARLGIRIAAAVATAALLAYGVVFHGGAVDDPISSSTAPLPTKST